MQNTYYFNHNETIGKNTIDKQKGEIKYYQWVSFYLLAQAFSFYVPHIFWKTFVNRGGLYIGDLVNIFILFLDLL